jgi:hypothetical protein
LPANRFILSIHDLIKTDLGKLDDLTHRYLKSWLAMPQSGSFLPIHSGLGMDVKSVSHLYKEIRSLDIVRALMRGDNTVQTTVREKVQREQGWTRKSAIYVCAAEIAETVFYPSLDEKTVSVIGDAAVDEPPLAIHDAQPQDPQPPQIPLHAQPGDLDLLLLHPHSIVEPGPQPPQVEPIPTQAESQKSQKCLPSGRSSREFFVKRRIMHGPLASAAIPYKETSLLCCRLRVRASLGSHTCGIFLVVF